MVFEEFYLSCLAQVFRSIGSEGVATATRRRRDVDEYLAWGNQHGLRIPHAIELGAMQSPGRLPMEETAQSWTGFDTW